MKTPKIYTDNLKEGIITKEMLSDCLFSVNKRAKNCRDKEREYRNAYRDRYDSAFTYFLQKNAYYGKKDKLLSLLAPTCIHVEDQGVKRVKVYDYEDDFYEYRDKFVHEGEYYDRELRTVVEFGVYEEPDLRYYLLYEVNGKTFHTPIDSEDVKKYSGVEIKEIGQLHTMGEDISDLISCQFVDKVLALIDTGNYTLKL